MEKRCTNSSDKYSGDILGDLIHSDYIFKFFALFLVVSDHADSFYFIR